MDPVSPADVELEQCDRIADVLLNVHDKSSAV